MHPIYEFRLFSINSDQTIKIPVLERSLDFTFWFSISPELEQRTQEVIHKKYGGREKAEKAARIIQESYRQYRLRQSFHKLR